MRLGMLGMLACTDAVRVELVEDEVAQVVPLGGGPARVVKRSSLPAGAREGAVVREGRLESEPGARLAREVAALRARLAVPVPDGLDLEATPSRALTSSEER